MRTGPKQHDYCTVHLPYIQDHDYMGLCESQKINASTGSLGHGIILCPNFVPNSARSGPVPSYLCCFQTLISADGLRAAGNHGLTVPRSSPHNLPSLHTHTPHCHLHLTSGASSVTPCTPCPQLPYSSFHPLPATL